MRDPLFPQPAPNLILDDPVYLQIRITPDRRCKVTVVLARQSEMPAAFHRILSLFQAPERQTADQSFLLRIRYPAQQLLQLLGMDLIP